MIMHLALLFYQRLVYFTSISLLSYIGAVTGVGIEQRGSKYGVDDSPCLACSRVCRMWFATFS